MLMLPPPDPPQTKKHRRGYDLLVGTDVKAKIGELEEEIREGFLRRLRKEMPGMAQEVVGKRRYLLSF